MSKSIPASWQGTTLNFNSGADLNAWLDRETKGVAPEFLMQERKRKLDDYWRRKTVQHGLDTGIFKPDDIFYTAGQGPIRGNITQQGELLKQMLENRNKANQANAVGKPIKFKPTTFG